MSYAATYVIAGTSRSGSVVVEADSPYRAVEAARRAAARETHVAQRRIGIVATHAVEED